MVKVISILILAYVFGMAGRDLLRWWRRRQAQKETEQIIREGTWGYLIENGILVNKQPEETIRIAAVADLRILAELTYGPTVDEHYFAVVDRDRNFKQIPADEITTETISELLTALGGKRTRSIANSPALNSCIIAPDELYGEPLIRWEAYETGGSLYTERVDDYFTRVVGTPTPSE